MTARFNENLERIVRPIVEGQIRGFLKEHPRIVEAVDWYAPRNDKARTFVNSLAKRIVRDLTCGTTTARLEVALLELVTETPKIGRGIDPAADAALLEAATETPSESAMEAYAVVDGGAHGNVAVRPVYLTRSPPPTQSGEES